ncbi:hypothetical protein CPB85DRAFT_76588 [Mucidula mucida]|nr:hypothetical protein CPB85DRAFT_76588 [Mucidula mucida]
MAVQAASTHGGRRRRCVQLCCCVQPPATCQRCCRQSFRNSTSIRVGVALFSKSASAPDPYFSWAIATTEGAWAEGEVVVYDIALGAKSRRWEPRARRGVYLREEEAFCGVLEFATTDIPGEDLDEFIRDHPSDDDGWRVCGPAGWATAMWTLKIMCSLEDAAIWEIPMEYGVDGLFDVIIGKAFE